MCIEIGVLGEFVIERAGESIPGPVIQIFLNIQAVVESSLSIRIEVGSGFNVVDRPAVVVIAVSTHKPEAFAMAAVGTETHPSARIDAEHLACSRNRRVAAYALYLKHRLVRGRLLDPHIDGATDGIAVLVRGERLINRQGANNVRWNGVEINLSNFRIGAGNNHPIDGGVAQPRFGSANLNILAFTLVSLQRHARHPPNGIRHICVGQTLDLRIGLHIEDVGRGALLVDGCSIAHQASRHNDLLIGRSNTHGCIKRGCLTGFHVDGRH